MPSSSNAPIAISLLVNLILVGAILFGLNRVGGWRFVLHRLQHDETGLYAHRLTVFAQMSDAKGAVVFLGDSQTEQYEWAEWYRADTLPVLNRGISGDYLLGILNRLPEIKRHKPRIIFLQAGVNDLLLGKTPDESAELYQTLVGAIRKEMPETALVLESVFPVNNQVKNTYIDNEKIKALNRHIITIARAYTIPYVDVYSQLANQNGDLSEQFTTDGIHLNAKGYAIWKQTIKSQYDY